MSMPHFELTDALLREALSRRSRGRHTSGELVHEVLVAVDTLPQAGRWSRPNLLRWRLLPAVAVVALPLAALIGTLLQAGGVPRPAPPPGVGEIAFVQSNYTCDPLPCIFHEEEEEEDIGIFQPRILFPSLHAEQPRILSVRGDGGVPAPLLDVPGVPQGLRAWSRSNPRNAWLSGPAVSWSPDGTRLAFRLFNDVPGIYVVHRSGIGATRLVELPLDEGDGMLFSPALAWSPDGTRIAFIYHFGGGQIFVVDTADGLVTELGVEGSRGLAWSPDGTKIAFARGMGFGPDSARLMVIGADGSGETELTAAHAEGFALGSIAWSPDGTRIAFERHGDAGPGDPNGEGLYTIAADGSGLRRLTSTMPGGAGCCIHFNRDLPLAWSPDGTRVASPGPDGSILLANADGSGERLLETGSDTWIDDLAWSPDGSRLVYATRRPEDDWRDGEVATTYEWSSIYVINADGSDRRWLAEGEYPDWSK